MEEEKEKRESRKTAFQVTASTEEDKRTVEGYALLFDTRSDGLHFEEVIERGALDGVLEKSDVLALLNHNPDRGILARWKRKAVSLNLEVTQKGLRYSFEAPKTALGDELLENIRRGEVDESSFAFSVESDTWERKKDGTWKRSIHKFAQIYDVSPVYDAAYSKTSVYMRGKEDAEKEILEAEQRESQKVALETLYSTTENVFNNL
ncbi:phage prohead protease, HK97 family [Bacteroidales bacterium Barb6]|nr:phage prohead protease, HK97 family [Bacteroidales bacterium Barb6]